MKLQKFENVDVIASLEAIMKQNTAFYQSDFDIDKQILRKAAVSLIPEDKRLLWFSRPSGTCCFRERDVFLKDTRQHNTWRFYGEQISLAEYAEALKTDKGRGKPAKQEKPSIRAQLKAAKEQTTKKQARQKTQDLERS